LYDQLDEMRIGGDRGRTWQNIQADYFNIEPINMRNIVSFLFWLYLYQGLVIDERESEAGVLLWN